MRGNKLDKFLKPAVDDYIDEFLVEKDLELTMKRIDKLVSQSKNPEKLLDDIVSRFMDNSMYEKGLIVLDSCGNGYSRLDWREESLYHEFTEKDPVRAYLFASAGGFEELAEMALEKLGSNDNGDLLVAYQACIRQGVGVEELVEHLHKKMVFSDHFGDFCVVALENKEKTIAPYIMQHIYEQGPDSDEEVDAWKQRIQIFADLGGLDGPNIMVCEVSGIRERKPKKRKKSLRSMLSTVKKIGKKMEKFYGIKIPHLKNINFKKPTGNYGSISIYGMMKRAKR